MLIENPFAGISQSRLRLSLAALPRSCLFVLATRWHCSLMMVYRNWLSAVKDVLHISGDEYPVLENYPVALESLGSFNLCKVDA